MKQKKSKIFKSQKSFGFSRCYECNKGKLIKKKIEYRKYGILIGKYPADVCDKCKEVFFDGKVVEEIEKKTKKMGLWGLRKKVKVGTSGNALDVKFSKDIVNFLKLHKGQEMEIEPVSKHKIEMNII